MKKWTVYAAPVILLALLVGCIFWLPATANAESVEGPYTYTVTNGEATITDCDLEISGDVVLPDRLGGFPVTTIGEYAFSDCTSLTAVTIPEGVTCIEMWAFGYCTSLVSVSIPESIVSIGASAFDSCTILSDADIPEGVISIGSYAFNKCAIASVEISQNVTEIGFRAFAGCPELKGIWVSPENEKYSSVDGILFNKSQTGIILAPGGYVGSYTVPAYVYSIEQLAFAECDGLTQVVIGAELEYMDGSAFHGCRNLTGIWVSEENANFSSDTFGALFDKDKTRLLQVPGKHSGVYTVPHSVESISYDAFQRCGDLTHVTLPDGLRTIESGTFLDCTALISVDIPDSVETIEAYAFRNCVSLKTFTIPPKVTTIPWNMMEGCTGLESIIIPEGVTTVESDAFRDCTGLRELVIPDSVTFLGSHAWYNCSNLTYVMIGDGVRELDGSAWDWFGTCENLETVILGDGLTKLPDSCSEGKTTLKNVVIGKSLTTLPSQLFSDCTNLSSVTLPNTVTTIDEYVFYNCINLNTIILPDSLTTIGNRAFANCTGLKSLRLPDSLTTIDYYAFSKSGLKSIIIPDSVTSLEQGAFQGCAELEAVTIGTGLTTIGSGAFSYCVKLLTVTIPDTVTSIEDNAFRRCDGLKAVYIGEGVVTIGSRAFEECISLEAVHFGSNVEDLGYETFRKCEKLGYLVLPGKVKQIEGGWMFRDCTNITEITVPLSLRTIDSWVFSDSDIRVAYYVGTQEQWETIDGKYAFGENVQYEHVHAPVGEIRVTESNTCMHLGFGEYTCVHGEVQKVLIPATGHSFTDYVSNGDATIYKDGTKTAKCDNCSETDTVTDPGSRLIPPGDINGDMAVTDADAVYLLRYTLFPEQYPIGEAVDYTGDGMTTDADAVYLLRHTLFPKQ